MTCFSKALLYSNFVCVVMMYGVEWFVKLMVLIWFVLYIFINEEIYNTKPYKS